MKRRRRVPRERSLVVFEGPQTVYKKGPLRQGRQYLFIGEIVNMPGHCVVADLKTGRLHSGYHTENFREADAGGEE
jgi:hypothetical protein